MKGSYERHCTSVCAKCPRIYLLINPNPSLSQVPEDNQWWRRIGVGENLTAQEISQRKEAMAPFSGMEGAVVLMRLVNDQCEYSGANISHSQKLTSFRPTADVQLHFESKFNLENSADLADSGAGNDLSAKCVFPLRNPYCCSQTSLLLVNIAITILTISKN